MFRPTRRETWVVGYRVASHLGSGRPSPPSLPRRIIIRRIYL